MPTGIRQRDNGSWSARFYDADGRSREKSGFRTRTEAQRWRNHTLADIAAAKWVDPRAGAITLAEWWQRWIDAKVNLSASSRWRYTMSMDNHVLPRLGHKRISAISRDDVRTLVAEMVAAGSRPNTVVNVLAPLSGCLKGAVEDERIAKDPTARVTKPRIPRREMVVLTRHEVAALAAAARLCGELITFLAYTGLRFNEAAALKVGDIVDGEVRVTKAFDCFRNVVPPKNGKPRTVPLTPNLEKVVDRLTAGRDAREPLLATVNGFHWDNGSYAKRVWAPAKESVGVDAATRLHDLRHTAATWIVQVADIKTAMEWLGHSSVATTARYIHTSPARLRAAALLLDEGA